MSHNFVGIMSSSHHYAHPFSYPCGEEDVREQHSLSISQRVVIIAISILIAIPTFVVGGILSFYMLSAALKARNVVWIDYTSANPNYHERVSFFKPVYWGFRIAVPRRSYSSYHYTPVYPPPTHNSARYGHHGGSSGTSSRFSSHREKSARSENLTGMNHGGHRGGRTGMGGRTIPGSRRR